jgi:hypothetical protein
MVSRENEEVSPDKDFEVVSGRVEYFHRKISESFNFWIRTFSAIVGGSFYLSIDPHFPHNRIANYVILSNSIVALMGLVTMVLIACVARVQVGTKTIEA